ncbi:MAG: hypothetical protein EOO43_22755, partial [Flavobacterium sp.]
MDDYFIPILTDHIGTIPFNFPTSPDHLETDNILQSTERKYLIADTMASSLRGLNSAKKKKKIIQKPKIAVSETNPTEQEEIAHFNIIHLRKEKVSSTHSYNLKPTDRVENKVFEAAILSKSYPKSFKILVAAFYLVILMTFISQLIMKSTSDNTMRDLQIKKNLLKFSQQRAYMASLVETNAVGFYSQIKGLFQSGGNTPNFASGVINLLERIAIMREANDQMLQDVYAIDKKIQDQLFVADIRMNGTYLDSYDTNTSKLLNTFQVTDEIHSVIRFFAGLANPTSLAGLHLFNYLQINLGNDFLYKSKEITEILNDSVEEQKIYFENITNLFLTLNPFLLAGIGILLI